LRPGCRCVILFLVVSMPALPGCHLLLRLGQERQEERPAEAAEEQPSAPSSGPETTPPPSPGLDSQPKPPAPGLDDGEKTPKPPAPGLKASRVDRLEARIEKLESQQASGRRQPVGVSPEAYASGSQRVRAAVRRRLSGNTGINTNTAIAPGEGQFVYRTQLRYQQAGSSPGPADIDVNLLVNPHVLAYGVRENFTVFGVVPFVLREGTARPPTGGFFDLDDQGVADLRFFGKYRFYEDDRPGETTRWSVFSGVEVPTDDKDFSSDSFDPFIGTVWTYQSLEWGVDLDWFWNFNTGDGFFRHDEMRYDFAYTYVLLTGQTLDDKFWQLNSIFELNGSYITDGSHLLFAAPGFQLALERMIVEASLQLPVIRDLKTTVEPDFLLVLGTRITW